MNPLHCLYSQYSESTSTTGTAYCYLCGILCSENHSVAKGIADTFNSHYLAKCPSSSWICDACFWYLDGKSDHPEFRKMSLIVCRNSWQNWARDSMKQDIARWLRDGLEQDSYLVVSLTKKKHILLQAQINSATSRFLSIQLEEQVAHVTFDTWQQIETPFLRLLQLGHGKGEILSGNLYANTLRKHGQLAEALALNSALRPWRSSPQIELYSYVTLVEKEVAPHDGTGTTGGATTSVSAGTRDTQDSSIVASGRVERHRQGISEQVSDGNLENVRGKSGGSKQDYEQLDLFSL